MEGKQISTKQFLLTIKANRIQNMVGGGGGYRKMGDCCQGNNKKLMSTQCY